MNPPDKKNTHHCGELREKNLGQQVILCGWVHKYRHLGHLHFMDIRDKYGITQLNFEQFDNLPLLKQASLESVVLARGIVQKRPAKAQNNKMPTGMLEIQVSHFEILSPVEKEIPFLPFGETKATEDLRLKYRHLDLRTSYMQEVLHLRSQTMASIRSLLLQKQFIEVETPILYRSTPEGARDYIVPSRIHPQKVYALPQSPQILKQLLMMGGVDKYFQIARCFRDEDLRTDRQPEFSQLDIEASFIKATYIKNLTESLIKILFNLSEDFQLPVLSYNKALEYYGTDKPDIRFNLRFADVSKIMKTSEFPVFEKMDHDMLKAVFLPHKDGSLSRSEIEKMPSLIDLDGKKIFWFKTEKGVPKGGIAKFITSAIQEKLNHTLESGPEDGICFFLKDTPSKIFSSMQNLRRYLADKFSLRQDGFRFVWIDNFPLMTWDEDQNRYFPMHHPFTMPMEDDLKLLMNHENLHECRADAYDVVCNGYEIGGGSLRIHDPRVQKRMFEALGMDEMEIKQQFDFFIEALHHGTPPHGGIAFGLDRIIMLLAGRDNIRDVIPFPKTTSAQDLTSKAPSTPSKRQIEELHFNWRRP